MELSQHTLYALQFPWFIYGTSDTRFYEFSMGFCPHEITMEYPWCRHHGITPWVFHGQAMVISYGQKPMENSWNISMTFPWGISIRELASVWFSRLIQRNKGVGLHASYRIEIKKIK